MSAKRTRKRALRHRLRNSEAKAVRTPKFRPRTENNKKTTYKRTRKYEQLND